MKILDIFFDFHNIFNSERLSSLKSIYIIKFYNFAIILIFRIQAKYINFCSGLFELHSDYLIIGFIQKSINFYAGGYRL